MRRSRRHDTRPRGRVPARRWEPARSPSLPPQPARDLGAEPAGVALSREVEAGNGTWRVRLEGSLEAGSGTAPGPRLLSVALESPGDAPNPEGNRYVVARDLEDVDEEVLRELVTGAARATGESRSTGPARGVRGSGRSRR